MQNSEILGPSGIVTFDRQSFGEACTALMQLVLQDGRPDALIGIRTGGLYVAEAMAEAAGFELPVLSVTCRRPSTRYKRKASGIKRLVAKLPRPFLDRLRVIEHRLLTRDPQPIDRDAYRFDPDEIALLDAWLGGTGRQPSLVVVDDAVDTGTTLSLVLDTVSRHAPPMAKIRSAVITVTTPKPWVLPHITLYRRQLCRFPWSLDA